MVIAYILLVLAAVILARTFMFTPKSVEQKHYEEIEQDRETSINNLAALIRCKTVSYEDANLEDDAEFEKLVDLLPKLYPGVCKTCPLMRFPGRALLFRWKGRSEGEASVLMAHYDVVPVEEEKWDVPAFDAVPEIVAFVPEYFSFNPEGRLPLLTFHVYDAVLVLTVRVPL